jgi:hypothetical protein
VVRDRADALEACVGSFVTATVSERARWSHRHRPETTDRYVRWRMEHFDRLLDAAEAHADLVLDGERLRTDPGHAAALVREMLDPGA